MDTTEDTHVVGEGLLEGDVGGDLGDQEPEAVPRYPEPRLPHQLEAERGRGAAEALLEGAAGDEGAHDSQREVEAIGRQRQQTRAHTLIEGLLEFSNFDINVHRFTQYSEC